jgi:hypothetical protein
LSVVEGIATSEAGFEVKEWPASGRSLGARMPCFVNCRSRTSR